MTGCSSLIIWDLLLCCTCRKPMSCVQREKNLNLNGKVLCGAMDHVSLGLKLIWWIVPVSAAWLKTAVCSPAVLMGITNGCRSEMRLTGRGGKTTRDERQHTYLLFTNTLDERLSIANTGKMLIQWLRWYGCRVFTETADGMDCQQEEIWFQYINTLKCQPI